MHNLSYFIREEKGSVKSTFQENCRFGSPRFRKKKKKFTYLLFSSGDNAYKYLRFWCPKLNHLFCRQNIFSKKHTYSLEYTGVFNGYTFHFL